MEPVFHENDVLYFKKVAFNKVRINDIVSVKKDKKLITHRVIYKSPKYLITKGDNNPISDGKVHPKQIIGKVYQVKRNNQIIDPEQIYLLQSTLYFQEIVKIKNAFEKEEINFVFLKGLPLHLYFEKTHPRRIYLDCDVLVDKKDFSKTESIMNKFGYKKSSQSLSKIHTLFRKKQIEVPFYKSINGFPVVFDIHLEIDWMSQQLGKLEEFYPQSFIDQLTNEFLQIKRMVNIQDSNFPFLTSNLQILYLALHLFHHNFRGAFRYDFLDKVVRKQQLKINNWQLITKIVNNYQLSNFVSPVFILLKKYYQTPIPKEFFDFIKPVNSLTRKLINRLTRTIIFDDEPRVHAGINRFKNLFLLSPNPLWKKMLVFFNPQVIYSIFWVLLQRLFSFFRIFFKPNSSFFK